MTHFIPKPSITWTLSAGLLLLVGGCTSGPSPAEPGLSDAETPTVPRLAALTMAADRPADKPPAAKADEGSRIVGIDNFSYTPATLTIAAGQSVTWVNHDDVPHTVTADDKRYTSKTLDTDDRYSHTFTAAGEFSYFCALHPHMTGKIIVK